MRRYFPFIIVVAVALATVGGGAMLYRSQQVQLAAVPKTPGLQRTEPLHIRGSAGAPVTIEEFADFQCPPCAGLASVMKQLEQDYQPRVRVVFRHFPLEGHQHARAAALAAEAAAEQGRFWEMHDLLYREQTVWSKAPDVRERFRGYAGALGLEQRRFEQDMGKPEVNVRVTSDHKLGASLGVNRTPTVFVNHRQITSLSADSLREAIDAALRAKVKRQP